MTHLAVIDLSVPGSDRTGRVFLDRAELSQWPVAELERELADRFVDEDDAERMALIEALLLKPGNLDVAVFPGEESPPVYHAYIKDPGDAEKRFFGCVLAPEPVVQDLIRRSPHPVFETATFQVMPGDTTPAAMGAAIEVWARRVWPGLTLPKFRVRPWPIEEVHSRLPLPPEASPAYVPRNAPALLDASDYPLPEELSA